MGWTQLLPDPVREKLIQQFCEDWKGRPPVGYRVAGAPTWWGDVTSADPGTQEEVWRGYPFCPDVFWNTRDDRLFLLELKSSSKWQPLALPEVLHHAEMLQRPPQGEPIKGPLTPVIISSVRSARSSSWLRASLRYLENGGFRREQLLLFYEFCSVKWKAESETLFWFDEPFARWELADPAFNLPPEYREGFAWYKLANNSAWIVTRMQLPDAEIAPLYWTQPYCLVEPPSGDQGVLFWFRVPPGARTKKWEEHFFHWSPTDDGVAALPSYL